MNRTFLRLFFGSFFLLAIVCAGTAQEVKGFTPSKQSAATKGVTRAVVVGISDYQDAKIQDLRFADRDAEAFANFLRSPTGGALDNDHLRVMINNQATMAQFDAALGWLIDESKEGDQAFIYFSGHGDVETKSRSQQGFLLFWDSPPQTYMVGGYPIYFLKEAVSTLSIEKKARVIVITDACRSGKLAGNAINGTELTGQNLAQQFANEVKILSCQPDELSLEGEQWGGGRGAFSYHLMDALYGMADVNSDHVVTLIEIGRYLEDKVSSETAPSSQLPMVVGNRTEQLAVVDSATFEQVKAAKGKEPLVFKPIDARGLEKMVLALCDSTIRKTYRSFQDAVAAKDFFESFDGGPVANDLYEGLSKESCLEKLHNHIRRNYAAALLDDFQQFLKSKVFATPGENSMGLIVQGNYRLMLQQISRAMELLGTDHYMHRSLLAKKIYLETNILLNHYQQNQQDSLLFYKDSIVAAFHRSLALEPDAPYVFVELSTLHYYTNNLPLAIEWMQKAVIAAPLNPFYSWSVCAYLSITGQFAQVVQLAKDNEHTFADFKSTFQVTPGELSPLIEFVHKSLIAVDTTYPFFHAQLGDYYLNTGRYSEAEAVLQKAYRLDSLNFSALFASGRYYLLQHQYQFAETTLQPLLSKSVGQFVQIYYLHALVQQGKLEKADSIADKLAMDKNVYTIVPACWAYQSAGDWEKAKKMNSAIPESDPFHHLSVAREHALKSSPKEARASLLKGLRLIPAQSNVTKCMVLIPIRLDKQLYPLSLHPDVMDWLKKNMPPGWLREWEVK